MQGLPVAYKPMNASGVVKDKNGEFYGYIVLASASGNVTFYDHESAASGNVLLGPINISAGQVFNFSSIAVRCARGIYMNLNSGTASLNVLYN